MSFIVLLSLAGAGYLWRVMVLVSEGGVERTFDRFDEPMRMTVIGIFFGLLITPWLMRQMERKITISILTLLAIGAIPLVWMAVVIAIAHLLVFQPYQFEISAFRCWLLL